MLQSYQVGETIDEALIWSSSKYQTVLTLKRSIIDCATENLFPKSIQDIEVDDVFPCVSTRHQPFGVFAKLICPPTYCDVLFPKKKMPQDLYSEAKKEHLSLEGKVISVDVEEKKISMSALAADVPLRCGKVLDAYFVSLEKIRTALMASSDEKLKHLACLKLGDPIVAKLTCDFDPSADIEFDLPHGLKGVVPSYHHALKTFKKNDLMVGCVLHCDLIEHKVFITTREDVIGHISAIDTLAPKECKLKAKILLNCNLFSLVSIHGKARDVAYVSNLRSVNDVGTPAPPPFEAGEEVTVIVNATASGKIATYHKPPKGWTSKAKPRQSKRPASAQQEGPAKKKAKSAECDPIADEEPSTTKSGKKDSNKKKKSVEKKKKQDQAAESAETVPVTKSALKTTSAASRPIVDEAEAVSPPKKTKLATKSVDKTSSLELPRLTVNSAFKWDDDTMAQPATIADSSDSEDEEAKPEKVMVKDRHERARQKLEEARREEAKLSQIESSLNDPDRVPVTADDFDRMVLASPNSSILWLQYMAFHLENAEIEKARTVAQRALKVISFREEQEKFNVWIAWLNLEHMYGTTEGYEETFQVRKRKAKVLEDKLNSSFCFVVLMTCLHDS